MSGSGRGWSIVVCCISLTSLIFPNDENHQSVIALSTDGPRNRRSILDQATICAMTLTCGSLAVPIPAIASTRNNTERLSQNILTLPPPSSESELNGIDNTYFPSFLAGEWNVTQTLVDTQAPLGLKYLGGPNGDMEIATRSFNEGQSKIGVPVKLKLRYVPTKWGVAEDRLYNNQARLDAFAGKNVVASVQYVDVGGCNRQSILSMGGMQDDPLCTTITYFKGPAAQKSFLTSHGSEPLSESSWLGYEVLRSIFALTNTNTAPPITTDVEYVWRFDRVNENTVRGKLRIAEYLNPQSDALYFDARQRAVSLQDYTLDMQRISQ